MIPDIGDFKYPTDVHWPHLSEFQEYKNAYGNCTYEEMKKH